MEHQPKIVNGGIQTDVKLGTKPMTDKELQGSANLFDN
jgi:hypothetical protein